MITYTHDITLMAAAILTSIVAAFTGLALTRNIAPLPEIARKTLLSMSAIVIGGGIWTMHFIAMLANNFSVPVGYDVVYTLGSGLISILMVGIALLILHYTERSNKALSLAGTILAAGIATMHYIGMNGMRGVDAHYSKASIMLTLVFALISCIYAVRVAYGKRSKEHIAAGGLLLGLSVVVVHYTAMHGTQYEDSSHAYDGTIAIAHSTLAIVLVVAAFAICGAFLLVSATFLTSSSARPTQSAQPSGTPSKQLPDHPIASSKKLQEEDATPQSGHSETTSENEVSASVSDIKPTATHGSAEKPDALSQTKQNTKRADSASTKLVEGKSDNQTNAVPVKIPIEQNKKLSYVDSEEVGSIRADGRYTQLYTRNGVYFCPWSITEAENNLQPKPFYRSHRSYLVNILLMSSFERRKDSGVCLFDDFDKLTKVPVSRTRVSGLLKLLGHG